MSSSSGQTAFPPRITPFPDEVFEARKLDRWSGAQISDDQIRALAVGAWYADSWDAFHDTVLLLPEAPDEDTTRREGTIDGLSNWWDITSSEDTQGTLRRLHAGMHAPTYAVVSPLAQQAARTDDPRGTGELVEQHRGFLRQLANFRRYDAPDALARDYDLWLQAIKLGITTRLSQPLASDIVAWDLVRAVWVARAAHTAGYISEEVAWDWLMRGLQIAQRHYANWRQLGEAYLTGAVYWQSTQDLSEALEMANSRRTDILRLWERPLSPWRRLPLHPGTPVYGFSLYH